MPLQWLRNSLLGSGPNVSFLIGSLLDVSSDISEPRPLGLKIRSRMGTKKSKRERQAELRRIYENPLPIIFGTKDDSKSWWSHVRSLFTIFPSVEVPVISGVYDAASNSVWIHDMQEARMLWERGFFGKGTLSRSEPTWLTREVNSRRHEKSGRKGEPRSLRSFWLKYSNLRTQ